MGGAARVLICVAVLCAGCLRQLAPLSQLVDAGLVARPDAGLETVDAGEDGGADAGLDAGSDAGAGGADGGLQMAPNPLYFGFVQPGNSVTLPVHLTNTGAETISVTPTLASVDTPPGFAMANGAWTGGDLAPGDSQSIEITFAPTEIQEYDAVLAPSAFTDGGASLIGYGGGPAIHCSPDSWRFVTVGNLAPWMDVTCTNSGWENPVAGLVLGSLVSDNPAYSAEVDPDSPDPASALQPLATNGEVLIRVTYTPTGTTSQVQGTLTINSNATDFSSTPPPTVTLSNDSPCQLTVSPSSVSFESQEVATTISAEITVTDVGQGDCRFQAALSADCSAAFATTDGPGQQQLSPSAGTYPNSVSIAVTFTPPDAGYFSCNLVASGFGSPNVDGLESFVIPISGSGFE